ncbi:MAG: hypothetical protein WCK03_03950 [Candidatus Taylorbacteria bacterium]
MNRNILEYFVKNKNVTVDQIINLSKIVFWLKVLTWTGVFFLTLTCFGTYMVWYDKGINYRTMYLIETSIPWTLALSGITIFVAGIVHGFVITDLTKIETIYVRDCLLAAIKRFDNIYDWKLLATGHTHFVKINSEVMIVRQMVKTLEAHDHSESASLKERAIIREMYDSAKEFCNLASYTTLFGQAETKYGKMLKSN